MPDFFVNVSTRDVVTVRSPRCPECGQASVLTLDRVSFELWQAGMPIQIAFPDMPVDEREVLINGLHPECFDAIFG